MLVGRAPTYPPKLGPTQYPPKLGPTQLKQALPK